MIIPNVGYFLTPDRLAVPLERYAQLMGCPEAAFFGVDWAGNANYHSPKIWTQDQRLLVTQALTEAQADMETRAGLNFIPTYHSDERHHCTTKTVRTLFPYLIEFGTKTIVDVSLNETVDYTLEPAHVGSIATSITDITQIRVYHPGTDLEIHPAEIEISGGVLDIYIPKARLVFDDNNPVLGWDFTDDDNFEATVDVKQEYVDDTVPVNLIKVTGFPVVESSDIGAVYIQDKTMGLIRVHSYSYDLYSFFDLNYVSGLPEVSPKLERAIVRFANSKLNIEPVDNDYVKTIWLADRDIPSNVSEENQNCYWGLSVGAWEAWKLTGTMVVHRAGSI